MRKIVLSLIYLFITLFHAKGGPVEITLLDSLKKLSAVKPAYVDSVVEAMEDGFLAKNDSLKYARFLDVKGHAKRNTGKYGEAIKSFSQAYDIYVRLGNREGETRMLNSIGGVLIRTTQFEEANGYYKKALKLVDPSDSVMLNIVYTNLGVTYDYTDKIELAIEMYKKALPYNISPRDDYQIGVVYHNIGVCYSRLEDFKNCEKFELQALAYQKKTNSQDQLARIGISLGGLYLDNKMLDKALYYFKLGGTAAEAIESLELQIAFCENIIDLYFTMNDSKNAMFYFDRLKVLREELHTKENQENIAEAETKFKISLKDKEIENLKISKNLADLKTERVRFFRNIMVVIIGLIAVLFFILYRNFLLRKKNFALLAREKQLIESEKLALEKNNEYLQSENVLARFEILKSQVSPHFLFNTLNSLSYLIEIDTDKAVAFTNAFSKLYRTVLELKEQNLITLKQELEHAESYFFLQQTRFGDSLKIIKNIDPEFLMMKLPPFSIQIAIENALNHNLISKADPLFIKLYCSKPYLVIENNLQEKINVVKSTSVGIANIKSRYSYFTEIHPEFSKTESTFIVRLPLLEQQD
ncbi:hypothetical protein BH11BAC2_BH11BAC2_08420 [soil metagenome]